MESFERDGIGFLLLFCLVCVAEPNRGRGKVLEYYFTFRLRVFVLRQHIFTRDGEMILAVGKYKNQYISCEKSTVL